jgi:hypothetical protein
MYHRGSQVNKNFLNKILNTCYELQPLKCYSQQQKIKIKLVLEALNLINYLSVN